MTERGHEKPPNIKALQWKQAFKKCASLISINGKYLANLELLHIGPVKTTARLRSVIFDQ